MDTPDTPNRILAIARDLVASEGLAALSFDAIAARLGRSKQAVLYWYPNKQALLAALFLPFLRAEAEAGRAAIAGATSAPEAITVFVRAIAAFHLSDLDRFRMMYLVPQTTTGRTGPKAQSDVLHQVHPVTDTLYADLAASLARDNTPNPDAARAEAFAIHTATLGLILMHALADRLGDPLKHPPEQAIAALIARLGGA